MEPKSWNDYPSEQMNALVSRRCLHTANLTIAQITLSKGAIVPLHDHANEQVTSVISGLLLFRMDGREILVKAGEMLAIPSGVPHLVEALEDSIAVDVFAPRREDWIRGDDSYLRR
ncbi:cupin domain-containing protein [Nevskia soli]|jgi:quercetin dioxygenase-like cupin family protein|uniref:cupin domain-containing protein n=1 Tax=Nevskia soli TaxID=418856 RepID=UPI0015D74C4F|nr:cupin domain-containing protein [Nevskia soli]